MIWYVVCTGDYKEIHMNNLMLAFVNNNIPRVPIAMSTQVCICGKALMKPWLLQLPLWPSDYSKMWGRYKHLVVDICLCYTHTGTFYSKL
jgi:hypothetical protein